MIWVVWIPGSPGKPPLPSRARIKWSPTAGRALQAPLFPSTHAGSLEASRKDAAYVRHLSVCQDHLGSFKVLFHVFKTPRDQGKWTKTTKTRGELKETHGNALAHWLIIDFCFWFRIAASSRSCGGKIPGQRSVAKNMWAHCEHMCHVQPWGFIDRRKYWQTKFWLACPPMALHSQYHQLCDHQYNRQNKNVKPTIPILFINTDR